MTRDEFERIFENQVLRSRDILVGKAKEYANDSDRMHNFKVAAAITGESPIEALAGMMVKHTVSVYDMIREHHKANFDHTKWDEKITDHINYLILLKALLVEDECEPTDLSEDYARAWLGCPGKQMQDLLDSLWPSQYEPEDYIIEEPNIIKGDI